MPEYPHYPTRDDEEQAPTPERIIDRIINGRFGPFTGATPCTPSPE